MVKEKTLVFFCLCFCHLVGVFGVDELKSVKEGDSVTLQTNVPEIQTDDLIKWKFGTDKRLIAKVTGVKSLIPDDLDVRFRDRLKLDEKTGSLTITNIRAEHAGVYEVEISSSSSSDSKLRFNVIVYAATTTPDLLSTSHSTSRPPSDPSSGSSSDSSSGPPSGPPSGSSSSHLIMPISAAAGFLFLVVSFGIFCIYRKQRKTDQQVESGEEITYADPTFYKRNTQKSHEDEVIYAGVVTRR